MARGIIPGSVNAVRKRAETVKKNKTAPITGIAIVIFVAKKGQL